MLGVVYNKYEFVALHNYVFHSSIFYVNVNSVFRYVPEDLPEVELPNLASKKRAVRKRGNTFPGDG